MRNAAQWASANRIMPPGSPKPGPFRTESTPYMIPVCEAFALPQFSKITFVMGTQMGKSATMQNIIGWRLDDQPAPIIYVGPTENNISDVVEPKIVEMFEQAASLNLKFDHKSPRYKKRVAGVHLRFAWAGSPAGIASDSAVISLVDELDRPDDNATGEGDLGDLVEARGDAFDDSKLGLTSTPTHGKVLTTQDSDCGLTHWAISSKGRVYSPIWCQWELGTRHEWAVPCPHCNQYFIPRSDLLWWPGRGSDDECSANTAFKEARLVCPSSGCQIEDKHRQSMNAKGVAVAPGELPILKDDGVEIRYQGESYNVPFHSFRHSDENTHFSIWVSGLCSFSAKKSYGFLAKKLLEALKSGKPGKILTAYNTGFGEVYAASGDAPEWEEVYALRSSYKSMEVPDGMDTLICTVDVQKRCLYYTVRGWKAGMTSRLIEHGQLYGDTDKLEVWAELDELAAREWEGQSLSLIGVDCGYRTDEVHAWVRRHKTKARALMGFKKLTKPFRKTRIEVSKLGKVRKTGDSRWDFDASSAKAWVHSRVRWARDQVGSWLLPADVTEDYCKQIVAEEFLEDEARWVRTSKDNHYLDCEGMQYMCARMLKIDRRKVEKTHEAEAVAEQENLSSEKEETEASQPETPVKKRAARTRKSRPGRSKKSGFVKRYNR